MLYIFIIYSVILHTFLHYFFSLLFCGAPRKGRGIINVNRRSSPDGFLRDDGDKYEKSAYTSEYQISVELKFCNIRGEPRRDLSR